MGFDAPGIIDEKNMERNLYIIYPIRKITPNLLLQPHLLKDMRLRWLLRGCSGFAIGARQMLMGLELYVVENSEIVGTTVLYINIATNNKIDEQFLN